MTPGPKPPTPKADAYYSAPRTPTPQPSGVVPPIVNTGYSPNTPTPGGATNGGSAGQ